MAVSESAGSGQSEHLSSLTQGEGREGVAFIPPKTLGWIINWSVWQQLEETKVIRTANLLSADQCDFFHCWGGS